MSTVEFHPEALLELEESEAWYRERDSLLATAFSIEVADAINEISTYPD